MSYYILQNDETKGPYTIGQLRSMWNSGAITGNTLYCEVGYEQWLSLQKLAGQLESPPPATQHTSFDDTRQAHGSIETRGRDSARAVKTLSGFCMIFGVVGGIIASNTDSSLAGAISALLLIGGFFGFVLGRFME